MKKRTIYITESDKRRLEELLLVAGDKDGGAREDLAALAAELAKAKIVSAREVPANVVTMNSKVLLQDVDTGAEMNYALVFPGEADIAAGAISVLAPVGTAILGYAKGAVIEWPVPSGVRRLLIKDILYQPEAAGDFHL